MVRLHFNIILFLMRSKLQIVWDLTFNYMYKLIILSTYLHSNQRLPSFFSYSLLVQFIKTAFQSKWEWSMGVPIK